MTTLPDWMRLPTGFFTHQLVDRPNPLPEAPETPERFEAIETRMIAGGLDRFVRRVDCGPAPRDVVLLAHDADYVEALERASDGDPEAQRRFSEPDTKVGPDTFRCAVASAGAVVRAVDALFERSVRNAFCAVRPPGHHASRGRAAGFCYLNNVAIGALYAIRRFKLERVAIIDFDAHHGDGTEEIVAGNPKIRFFSIFQWPFYPNRRMEPTPMNVEAAPVEAGADGAVLREILETDWLPKLERFRPQFIFCSSGFDAHSEEPMAQLKATELDYAYLTRRLVEAATVVCEGRLVSVLEGGYSIGSLARSAVTHLQALLRTPEPS